MSRADGHDDQLQEAFNRFCKTHRLKRAALIGDGGVCFTPETTHVDALGMLKMATFSVEIVVAQQIHNRAAAELELT